GERDRRDVIKERPKKILPDGAEGHARETQRLDDLRWAAFHEHDIPGLDRNVGPGADGNAEIGLRECWRIIDAVADEGDTFAVLLQTFNLAGLVLRQYFGEEPIDVKLAGDSVCRRTIVASNHHG